MSFVLCDLCFNQNTSQQLHFILWRKKIQFVDHSTYEITWGQTGENSSALRTSFQGATVTGGINLKLFTGAAAKGIPEEKNHHEMNTIKI